MLTWASADDARATVAATSDSDWTYRIPDAPLGDLNVNERWYAAT